MIDAEQNPAAAAVLRYLNTGYKDGARGEGGKFDCWGLTRAARGELYPDRRSLPNFAGELRFSPREFTRCYLQQARVMERVEPRPGAICAVLCSKICVHVGLITHDVTNKTDGLFFLDINPGTGARWIRIEDLKSAFYGKELIYYDDKSLPQRD